MERHAGAPEAALHFIGDQQSARLRARIGDGGGKRGRQRPHAAFSLHGLGDDRRCPRGYRGKQRRRIVDRHELHVRKQRLEGRPIVLVGRDRQRAKRAAVKRLFERDELRPGLAFGVPIAARELQARLDGFRAAVAEKRARQA